MSKQKVYQLGEQSALVRVVELDMSDVCPRTGAILIPKGCVTTPPPAPKEGHILVFDGAEWQYEQAQPAPVPYDMPSKPDKAAFVRAKRNAALADSDWTQLPDSPLSTAKKAEWRAYRKALRDITKAEGFPNVELPECPL